MKDEGYVQKWHLRHKTSDISETKQSREKSLQSVHKSRVRPFDWRQSWKPMVNFGLLLWGANFFSQRISRSAHFCRSATKSGNVESLRVWLDWLNETYSPNFVHYRPTWSGRPVIPCGDMHQSFTGTSVKWFFDISIFADSFSVLPIHCVAWGLGASFHYKFHTSRVLYYQKGHSPTQFSAHVYWGQTAGWTKMPLGTEVNLGADDVLDTG